ncbi:hypothetical protein F5Y18DRAFT_78493 [Xylariaceae sp. FL1019]|nr:hypothetical protein F5Y18DRAFT_78493 [Xylariaceae sp. FL1019]
MDALKNFANSAKESTGSGNTNTNTSTSSTGQTSDYGDKGAEYINKKYNNDSMSKDQLEKITDGAREGFEKISGKDIPDKYSN